MKEHDDVLLIHMVNGTKRSKHIRITAISVRLAWDRIPPTFAERAGYLDGKARGIPARASFGLATFLAKNYPTTEELRTRLASEAIPEQGPSLPTPEGELVL